MSREGFQSIDEYLENHRNVERHEWVTQPQYENMKDYELMTNRVEWAYPTQTREFVALDIIDRPRKILISKSALHPERPGGSRYQTEVPLDETDYVRAVQYYASKVEPLPDGKCLLRMVTWGEMCDSYTAFWINKFNAHVFITPKYKRFRRVMEDGEEVFELSNIVNEAWKLPKLLMIKPDHSVAKGSNFVDNLRNQGIEVCMWGCLLMFFLLCDHVKTCYIFSISEQWCTVRVWFCAGSVSKSVSKGFLKDREVLTPFRRLA